MSSRQKSYRVFAVILIGGLLLLDISSVFGQSRRPLITTSLGVIRNLSKDADRPHYSVYPEVQFNAPLFGLKPRSIEIDGSIYIGGFREGGTPIANLRCGPQQEPDSLGCFESFHRGLILGARMNVVLTKAPAYFSMFVGFSRHYAWTIQNSFYYEDGVFERNTSLETSQAVETGLRIQVPVNNSLLVGAGFQAYWRLAASEHEIDPRAAYTLGLSYRRR